MNVEFRLPGRDHLGRVFLTWTPVEARVRVANPTGTAAVPVTLGNGGAAGGGRVTFSVKRMGTRSSSLALDLPVSGAWVSFFVAGEFGRPSVSLGDAVIESLGSGSLGLLGTRRVTVRIRKDAQTLSAAERDRFLAAFGTLNGSGAGRFRDFRDMHVNASVLEAHGNVGFLPWHRAYLLDLERELQAIDARVTLPYWRFDRPAPNVFTREFMGVPNVAGQLQFTPGHPFTTWRTDGALGITRTPLFNTANVPPGLLTEQQTINLGGPAATASYSNFGALEGNPHGSAHVSFTGFIRSLPIAARDPLFFLLHCNVDRLWAKWQWIRKRTSQVNSRAFAPPSPDRIGHHLPDTMWPWNGVTGAPRPPTAPGGTLAPSRSTTAPGPTPIVGAMIDYQAVGGGGAPLGFAYDDVPFV